jgi:hypothetical protein
MKMGEKILPVSERKSAGITGHGNGSHTDKSKKLFYLMQDETADFFDVTPLIVNLF